jgi:microcystin degradation protein MlrC
MARIAVGGFHHETNTFVSTVTDYAYFCSHRDRPPLVRGPDVFKWLEGNSFALSGFMAKMRPQHELVPLLWTSGGAGGNVTRDAFERISAEMISELSLNMPYDAIYLDMHGAMATEDFEDGEGEMLRRVRAVAGEGIPVFMSLDYHANVTPAMTSRVDAIIAYRTYPHVDRQETGERAAAVMRTLVARGRPSGRALRKLPFLIPLHSQCTMVDPSRAIVELADSTEGGDVVSVGYLAGFPPADIFDCGPAIVVHAFSQAAADAAADSVARFAALQEAEFAVPLYTPEAAVQEAKRITANASRPVILADTQDNPGAGGSADTTGLLAALINADAQGAVLGFLCDPDAVASAQNAGEDAEIRLALGGKHGPDDVLPFEGTFRVAKLATGRFTTTGPVSGNREVDLGPMALLQAGGVGIAITSKRMQALDQAPFRHLGVEPKDQKILALKSTVHFRGDFQDMAEVVLVVEAPGDHLCDTSKYPYQRLRTGVRLTPFGPAHAPELFC